MCKEPLGYLNVGNLYIRHKGRIAHTIGESVYQLENLQLLHISCGRSLNVLK